MGILDRITAAGRMQAAIDDADRITAGLFDDPSGHPIASPWSDPGDLAKMIAADVFGVEDPPISSRTAAMRIPAVARGRNLIVSSIARMPLRAYDALDLDPEADPLPVAQQPLWMSRCSDGTTPQHRLAWTVDDLIFRGWSLWSVERDRNDTGRYPLNVNRVNHDRWEWDPDTRGVKIDGQPVTDPSTVCLIPGLHEGILSFGRDVLTDARHLYDIVRARLDSPMPSIILHQTKGKPLTKAEREAVVDSWAAARRRVRGGVGWTSEEIEATPIDAQDPQLMIEARNAASLDLARMIGVTAGLLDASVPTASLTYETTVGRNSEFVDRDLALYMTPIVARLSLPDMLPGSKRADFDLTGFTSPGLPTTGPGTAPAQEGSI